MRVHPRTLLTPERLDLVVKYRYFLHLRDGGKPGAVELYRWHIIQRTNGVEPGSWKLCIADYESSAFELLRSMRTEGFKVSMAVPIGSNGRIRGGAHRTACALVLDYHVAIRCLEKAGRSTWGADWFLENGMPALQVKELLQECEMLRRGDNG